MRVQTLALIKGGGIGADGRAPMKREVCERLGISARTLFDALVREEAGEQRQ